MKSQKASPPARKPSRRSTQDKDDALISLQRLEAEGEKAIPLKDGLREFDYDKVAG